MSNRLASAALGWAAMASTTILLLAPVSAQTATGPAQPYTPPRTADGQPRIDGTWHGTPGGSYSIENLELQAIYQQRRRDESRRGKSRLVDPPDGKIPYQPWAAAKAKNILDNHLDPKPEHLDPVARCVVQGVPRGMYQGEYEIIQTPTQILFMIEPVHQYRVIPIDGRPQPPEQVKMFMGSSRGRWEGNTLVVTTTNFNNLTWFDIVGSFHSDALKIVERFTIVDANTITYRATIEDPKVYTRPWTLGAEIQRMIDYEIMEEACHEGERSAEHGILARPGR